MNVSCAYYDIPISTKTFINWCFEFAAQNDFWKCTMVNILTYFPTNKKARKHIYYSHNSTTWRSWDVGETHKEKCNFTSLVAASDRFIYPFWKASSVISFRILSASLLSKEFRIFWRKKCSNKNIRAKELN